MVRRIRFITFYSRANALCLNRSRWPPNEDSCFSPKRNPYRGFVSEVKGIPYDNSTWTTAQNRTRRICSIHSWNRSRGRVGAYPRPPTREQYTVLRQARSTQRFPVELVEPGEMGSGSEERLGVGRNPWNTAQLDEHTRKLGKNRNDEGEGNAKEKGPGSFTRAPRVVSFLAAKFTDYDACDLGPSSSGLGRRDKVGLTARGAPTTLLG